MQTLQTRFAEALLSLGLKEAQTKSRKYRVFADRNPGRFYYIGRSGSLRVGRCYSESRPVSDSIKRRLLAPTVPATPEAALAAAISDI